MNRHDTSSQNMLLVSESASLLKPVAVRRLIVLVPGNVDCTTINHRIWKLAQETNSVVHLLALYKDPEQEPALRRELVMMSAWIQDAKVPVEVILEKGTNWIQSVKRNYEDGDMVVCIAEQSVGLQHRPLSQVLRSDLKIPIYILSELPAAKTHQSKFTQITVWMGYLGILASFFTLQLKVTQLEKDPLQTIFLIVLLIPEFWLIGAWNSLFS